MNRVYVLNADSAAHFFKQNGENITEHAQKKFIFFLVKYFASLVRSKRVIINNMANILQNKIIV